MPVRKPQARADARRAAILRAALECFDELGYEQTSIEDIRARSGASTGSIYHHFQEKQGIAARLFLQGIASYQQHVLAALGPDPRRSIRGFVEAHVAWVEANRPLARFLGERRDLEVVLRSEQEFRTLNRQMVERFRTWLEGHVESGHLRRLGADAFLAVLVGPADLFTRRLLAGQTTAAPAEVASELGDAAWRALRTPQP